MIGLIDHFDSFTYNIVALLHALGEEVEVVSHGASLSYCLDLRVRAWIFGPGPGSPADTGVTRQLIGSAPALGICLGHQLIGEYFGARITRTTPHHGVQEAMYHAGHPLFQGLPSPFHAVRYHSLVVEELPDSLMPIAWTAEGTLMGLAHRQLPLFGVQFHPDSIASECGREILANFCLLSQTEVLA